MFWSKDKLRATYGYSAIELMLVLSVIGLVIYLGTKMTESMLSNVPSRISSQSAYIYAQSVVRYITTHQNLLRSSLSEKGISNGKIATVSPKILFREGFIMNGDKVINNLKQIPCTIIYYDNKQLQAFIYYRDNNDSIQLSQSQLTQGLNHMGAMLGLYQNGHVIGSAKDWALESKLVNQLFIYKGNADISQGVESEIYVCSGSQIANSSYVVNVTTMLSSENTLFKDDSIYQYQDPLRDGDDLQSNNKMNSDLIMDFNDGGHHQFNNIIFQNNPNCIMNPNDEDSMKEYDPISGKGCKNKQLGLQVKNTADGNQEVTVTGFRQGGVKDVNPQKPDNRPYVGEVSAASFQPTIQIDVGTLCDSKEIGKMARQKKSVTSSDINNIYIGQVVCMKSITCSQDNGGYCYLPIQSVTINYSPNVNEFKCPSGMYISDVTTNVNQSPQFKEDCCHWEPFSGWCLGHNKSHHRQWKGYFSFKDNDLFSSGYVNFEVIGGGTDRGKEVPQPIFLATTNKTNLTLANRVKVEGVRYMQDCDWICRCGEIVRTDWQPLITSITCTNDPSKAVINVEAD